MEGKLIYIIIGLLYAAYSYYSKKEKEEAAKRKSAQRNPPPSFGTPSTQTEAPRPAAPASFPSWTETLKEIMAETQQKKKTVAPKPTTFQKSKSAYDKKKKAVQEKVFVPMVTDEMSVDEQKGIPDEAVRTTSNISSTDIQNDKAYEINAEEIFAYEFNARQAFVQSVILNRPQY